MFVLTGTVVFAAYGDPWWWLYWATLQLAEYAWQDWQAGVRPLTSMRLPAVRTRFVNAHH